MKVAILGTGGLGRAIALELASDPRVDRIVLVDKRGERSKALKSIGKSADVTAVEADVTNRTVLRRILSDADVAVNATLPDYNLEIMDACLEAQCAYLDSSGCSPTEAGERRGVLEQLALEPVWRDRKITAIVSLGSDPGLSNVMARVASERFSSIDRILVRKAATGAGGVDGFPLYSREIFLRDALSHPVVWDGRAHVEREPASGQEDYVFPDPIGTRRVHLFRHEEVLTLPVRLGKPVGWVDYKHDINPDLVRAIHAFHALGLLAPDRKVKVGTTQIPFREAFLSSIPEPSTMIGPLAGALGIVVEVRGAGSDGRAGAAKASIVVEHREANRRRGTTAERFLTAAAIAAGVGLIETDLRPGVLAPEELPPGTIVPALEARGIRFHVEDVAV